jgi:hypothetical protein
VRKICAISGTESSTRPVSQSASPPTARLIVLRMHVLSDALSVFGAASGGPKRQPAAVQRFGPPAVSGVVWPSVRRLPLHVTPKAVSVPAGTGIGCSTVASPPPR